MYVLMYMCPHFVHLQVLFSPYLSFALVLILNIFLSEITPPLHLHYLYFLDSVDTMSAFENDGEVDGVWLNSP